MRTRLAVLLSFAFAVLVLAGCGGSGHSSGSVSADGSAEITFLWPDRDRLIPLAAESVKLVLQTEGNSVEHLVNRPTVVGSATSNIRIDGLIVGTYTVTGTAYPNPNGTGTAQAIGQTAVTITQGQLSTFTITMASTVVSMEVDGPDSIKIGSKKSYSAKARNASGAQVLVDPSTLRWVAGSNSTVNGVAEHTGSTTKLKSTVLGTTNLTLEYTEPDVDVSGTKTIEVRNPTYVPGGAIGRGGAGPGPGQGNPSEGYDVAGLESANRLYVANDLGSGLSAADGIEAAMTWQEEIGVSAPGGWDAVSPSPTEKLYALRGNSVYVYEPGGSLLLLFTVTADPGEFVDCIDIAVNASGQVYVLLYSSQAFSNVVRKYESDGTFQPVIADTFGVERIACDSDGVLYLLHGGSVTKIGLAGTPIYDFLLDAEIVDIASSSDGNLYMLTTFGLRVVDEGGNLLYAQDLLWPYSFLTRSTPSLGRISVDPVTQRIYLLSNYYYVEGDVYVFEVKSILPQ